MEVGKAWKITEKWRSKLDQTVPEACAVKLLNKFAFKTSLDFIFVFLANKR